MSRYRATLDGSDGIVNDNSDLEAENQSQQVYLWDVGPEKPSQPKRPLAPKGKEGEPDFELAMIEFRETIESYAKALAAHRKAVVEYDRFDIDYGGPYEIQRWSVDAADALSRDAQAVKSGAQTRKRYYISARTRGYAGAPNRGLPEGMSPGRGHAVNVERERAGMEEFEAARKSDPVFGEQRVHA